MKRILLLIHFILLTSQSITLATTVYDARLDSLWGDVHRHAYSQSRFIRKIPMMEHPSRDLGNYIGQFIRACQFLTEMQELNPDDVNYGGIHEGEGDQLWAIVETDNTQESIVVWSLYATYLNDSDRYRENIDAAWEYCDRFPAWEEAAEGHYYALHNAGWGLMAELFYRRAYGEDRLNYGRECAEYLLRFTPREIPPNDFLMPLVMGWSSGTLYMYGQQMRQEEWIENALEIGNIVKNWIDQRPERLRNNEIWALCGGTAMWGVLTSLGNHYPDSLNHWAQEKLREMDVFAGRGNWNNSWNIWYAHAWKAAYDLWGDEEWLTNAITIVDSLIAQDYDRDGGIPATIGDPSNRDQSWVSAYTAWMGLFNNFEQLPNVDIAPLALTSPIINRPLGVGIPINFRFSCIQQGREPEVNNVSFRLFIFGLEQPLFSLQTSLQGWFPTELGWDDPWIPQRVGRQLFILASHHNDDLIHNNDSLTFELNILPTAPLVITIHSEEGRQLEAILRLFQLPYDSLNPSITLNISSTQPETLLAIVGSYRGVIVPNYPYASRTIEGIEISEQTNRLDLSFRIPPVLIVNADYRGRYGEYYERALSHLNIEYYTLPSSDFPAPETPFPVIILFTGDTYEELLPSHHQQFISEFLDQGGKLFLSGQNLSEALQGSPFLSDVIRVRHLTNAVSTRMMLGVPQDPILGGREILVLGNLGANNQTSPDGITPAEGAVT
ncbi:MAG: hypothetical protein ACK4OO_03670, partial [bacterium]